VFAARSQQIRKTTVGERVTVTRFDDFDNELEANETVTYALDGTTYEVDLSDENAMRLRTELQKWINVSRKVSGPVGRRHAVPNGRPSGGAGLPLAEIRAWAKDNGLEVPDRGRVSAAIVRAWTAAQPAATADAMSRSRSGD
jgi:hypothetical protein